MFFQFASTFKPLSLVPWCNCLRSQFIKCPCPLVQHSFAAFKYSTSRTSLSPVSGLGVKDPSSSGTWFFCTWDAKTHAGYLVFKRNGVNIHIASVVWQLGDFSPKLDDYKRGCGVLFYLPYKFGKLSPNELSMLCMLNFSEVELAISCYFLPVLGAGSGLREVHGLPNVIQWVKVSCLEAELTSWLYSESPDISKCLSQREEGTGEDWIAGHCSWWLW